MKHIFHTRNYFILSTGRTGTTFLHKLLTTWEPQIACFQEPRPSWIFQIYSNLKAERAIGNHFENFISHLFSSSRSKLLEGINADQYIEISPFTYGLGETLRKATGEFRVIHIVRHPFTCIPSMLNFKPQGWRNFFIDFPLWNLNVSRTNRKSPIPWGLLSKIEKKAWQWRYINQTIQSYQNIAKDYVQIKYEHLFSHHAGIREKTFKKLLTFLSLDTDRNYSAVPLSVKVNKSQKDIVPAWEKWKIKTLQSVTTICADLMSEYDYRTDRLD